MFDSTTSTGTITQHYCYQKGVFCPCATVYGACRFSACMSHMVDQNGVVGKGGTIYERLND